MGKHRKHISLTSFRRDLKFINVGNYKRDKGCQECGETNYERLTFHHLNPEEKEFDVNQMIYNDLPWAEIYEEIEKCIVLCLDCHRKLHGLIKKED